MTAADVRHLLDDSVRRKLAHAAREVARLAALAAHPDRAGVAGLLLDPRQELAMLEAIAARRGIVLPTPDGAA